MLLITHILVSISCLAYSVFTTIKPNSANLKISYLLLAGTLISGTYLVLSLGTHILESCVMGLIISSISIYSIVHVNRKLALQEKSE